MTGTGRVGRGAAEETALEQELLEHLRERLHIDVPGPDAELLESGLIDSLAFVELILIISGDYGVVVEMADLDVANFRTIRHIAAFIVAHRPAGS
jgi:acyl carrier protein